jgi:hypothetical protein
VLLVKLIGLTFAIAIVTLLTQLFPILNYSSVGNSFADCQAVKPNLIQGTASPKVDRFSDMSEYLACLSSKKKPPLNLVKQHMKIKFRQSGGYAGLRMGCDLDTDLLSTAESSKLESLVKASGISQSKSSHSKNTADVISYQITIETKDGTHQMTFDDLTLPESVIPLLDYLQNQAQVLPLS